MCKDNIHTIRVWGKLYTGDVWDFQELTIKFLGKFPFIYKQKSTEKEAWR